MKDKPTLAIIGPHGSLSGVLANSLAAMGVYFGEQVRNGENAELAALCEHYAPFPQIPQRLNSQEVTNGLKSILATLHSRAENRCVAIKHPTLAALLPELEAAGPMRWIVVGRPLEQCVQSLTRKAAAAPPHAFADEDRCRALQLLLWRSQHEFFAQRACHLVDSNRLLERPGSVLADACRACSIPYAKDDMNLASSLVRRHAARHSRASLSSHDSSWTTDTTVAIKTYERPRAVARLIACIKKHYPAASIVVADDSKTAIVRQDVKVLRLPRDVGVAEGRNRLLKSINTPYVFLMDDDQVFDASFSIQRMKDLLVSLDLDILACEIAWPDGNRRGYYGHLIQEGDLLRITRTQTSGGLLIECDVIPNCWIAKTESVRRVLWDSRLKTGEHLDFCFRAKQAGLRLAIYKGQAVVDAHPFAPLRYRKGRSRARQYSNESLAEYGKRWGFSSVYQDLGEQDEAIGDLSSVGRVLLK